MAVAMGAVVGALARKNIADLAVKHAMGPWHIAAINVGGSAALGALVAAPNTLVPPRYKLCLGVGACGAFTTFSTFSVDVVHMLEAEQFAKAASYVLANNVGSIGSAFGSYKVVKALNMPRGGATPKMPQALPSTMGAGRAASGRKPPGGPP